MLNQALTIVADALFVADLHTTSEVIKKGVGKESNPLLGGLNKKTPWSRRFWMLAAVKGLSIAAVTYVGFTQEHAAVPYLLGALDLFYGYIVLVNNLPIYRETLKE